MTGAARPRLQVGLAGLTAQAPPDRAGASEAIRTAVDCAVAAEAAGFDSVWTAEHHGAPDGFMPSPLVLLAAIAQATERVTLGTNVVVAPLWEPIRLAEEAVVVDHLAGGRLVLGLGLGYMEHEFAALGHDFASRADRAEQIVGLLRSAWAGQPITAAAIDAERGIVLTPPPFRHGGPPIWIGGFIRKAVERAARLGAGYLGPTVDASGLEQRVEWLRQTAPVAPGFTVSVTAFADLTEGRGAAPALPAHRYVAPRPTSAGQPVRAQGTSEECIEQLRPLAEALGRLPDGVHGLLSMCVVQPGLGRAENVALVRRFGAEVLPALVEASSAATEPR